MSVLHFAMLFYPISLIDMPDAHVKRPTEFQTKHTTQCGEKDGTCAGPRAKSSSHLGSHTLGQSQNLHAFEFCPRFLLFF